MNSLQKTNVSEAVDHYHSQATVTFPKAVLGTVVSFGIVEGIYTTRLNNTDIVIVECTIDSSKESLKGVKLVDESNNVILVSVSLRSRRCTTHKTLASCLVNEIGSYVTLSAAITDIKEGETRKYKCEADYFDSHPITGFHPITVKGEKTYTDEPGKYPIDILSAVIGSCVTLVVTILVVMVTPVPTKISQHVHLLKPFHYTSFRQAETYLMKAIRCTCTHPRVRDVIPTKRTCEQQGGDLHLHCHPGGWLLIHAPNLKNLPRSRHL
ncbi:hypothetical protein BaRGS_00016629, partial [Batillaria attramentaria]